MLWRVFGLKEKKKAEVERGFERSGQCIWRFCPDKEAACAALVWKYT